MVSLESLPIEILERILDLAITIQYVQVQQFIFGELTSLESPSGIPSLFLVSKFIHQQVVPVFYSRAILNIAPLRPPPYLFDTLSASGPRLNLRTGLDILFTHCNPSHLRLISTVNIGSGQSDAINAEAYEALLGWLVENTAVKSIYLSPRMMTRLRRGRTDLACSFQLANNASIFNVARTVYVYSARQSQRLPWEIIRMREFRRLLAGRELPSIQSSILEWHGTHDALLDPRWDVRSSDDAEMKSKMDTVASFLDSLMGADTICSSQVRGGGRKLYQVLFVLTKVHWSKYKDEAARMFSESGLRGSLNALTIKNE